MNLSKPAEPWASDERTDRLVRRTRAVANALLDQAGWPAPRAGMIGSLYPADPVSRRFWLSSKAEGRRLYVEAAEVPGHLPSPSARRAADLMRAVRAALS